MALALVEKTLNTALFSQVVPCKEGTLPVRAYASGGQLVLQVYEDSTNADGHGFRVWVASVTDSEDLGRFDPSWFVGSATVSAKVYNVYAQALAAKEAEEYKPSTFIGAWDGDVGYAVGDQVSHSNVLYVARNSIAPARPAGTGTSPDSDTTNWDVVLAAGSGSGGGGGSGPGDHGALNGLGDDDHPQYVLADGSRPMTALGINITGSPTVPLQIEDTGTTDAIYVESSDAGSLAGPVITMKRNSASPATADYLGQLKFKGESDTGADRVYAKITAKINSAANGNESGILEIMNRHNGSEQIALRLRQDSFRTLNGVELHVDGNTGLGNNNPSEKLDVTGNIAVSGTVDGRDVSVDGAKLDGIAAGATAVTFAAGDVTSQTVTTSYAVVTTNTPSINTAGITFSSSEFTAPAALAGKYISFAMTLDASQSAGNNRIELDLVLQKFNGSTWDDITRITNYAQRATSHNSGGLTMAESFDLSGALSGGEQYRWMVRQVGTPTVATSVLSSYTIKVYS